MIMPASSSNIASSNEPKAFVDPTVDCKTSLEQSSIIDNCLITSPDTTSNWNIESKQQQHQPSLVSVRNRSALVMHIRTQTWFADSHGLFDYESRSVITSEFKCTCLREVYHVCRIGAEIRFLPENEAELLYQTDKRAKSLVIVSWDDGCYNLIPPNHDLTEKNKKLWLVVRHLHNQSVVLTQGDLLKLGRFELRIKEVVKSPNQAENSLRLFCHDDDDCETIAPDPIDSANELENTFNVPKKESKIQSKILNQEDQEKCNPRICRICLCEAGEGDRVGFNPLVAPCECKGSMRWVHLLCLRTWMAGRLNIHNDGSMVSFFWKELECELCRLAYPPVVRVKDTDVSTDDEEDLCKKIGWKTLDLFEIPKLEYPYAILEPKTNQQDRGVYLVSLANNKIARLGRGHESDIRLADISVSRLHSTLRYQTTTKKFTSTSLISSKGIGYTTNELSNGFIIIDDNRSKFGTLLQLKTPFRLEPNTSSISIQSGRTVITISVRRRWRMRMPTCIKHNNPDIYVILHQQPNNHLVLISDDTEEEEEGEVANNRTN